MCVVSVVVPVFNAVKSVETSLRSVLNQSFSDWELVVVDDGSTDGTGAVLDRVAMQDTRVRVIHKRNTGSGDSRNVGMAAARGKYLCFLDSDDLLEPDALEFLVARAEHDHTQILFYNNSDVYYDNAGNVDHIEDHEGYAFDVTKNEGFKRHFLALGEARYLFTAWNKLYLREFVEQVGARFATDIKVGEDMMFTLPLYRAVMRVSSTDRSFYRYTIREGSLLHSFDPDRYREARLVYRNAEREIGQWYAPGVAVYARDFIVQSQSYIFDLFKSSEHLNRFSMLRAILRDPVLALALKCAGHMPYRGQRVFVSVVKLHNLLLLNLYIYIVLLIRYMRIY